MSETYNLNRAYEYIVVQAKKLNFAPPIDSDERLAEALDVPLEDIVSLKKCLSKPTDRLVTAFKKLVCPEIRESEVDSYLVTPFKTK